MAVLIGHDRGTGRSRIEGGVDGELVVGDLLEVGLHGARTGGGRVESRVVGADRLRELGLVAESNEHHQVLHRSRRRGGLNRWRGETSHPFTFQVTAIGKNPRFEAEEVWRDPTDHVPGRHDGALIFLGPHPIAAFRVPNDDESVRIVEPMVVLVATREALDPGPIGLGEHLWHVFQVGGLRRRDVRQQTKSNQRRHDGQRGPGCESSAHDHLTSSLQISPGRPFAMPVGLPSWGPNHARSSQRLANEHTAPYPPCSNADATSGSLKNGESRELSPVGTSAVGFWVIGPEALRGIGPWHPADIQDSV